MAENNYVYKSHVVVGNFSTGKIARKLNYSELNLNTGVWQICLNSVHAEYVSTLSRLVGICTNQCFSDNFVATRNAYENSHTILKIVLLKGSAKGKSKETLLQNGQTWITCNSGSTTFEVILVDPITNDIAPTNATLYLQFNLRKCV